MPASPVPITSVAQVIARMEEIEAAVPAADGLACFNRMYLQVTRQVNSQLGQGSFADPAFMTHLDVRFASLCFGAVDAAGGLAAAQGLVLDRLAASTAAASRLLLVAV